VVFPVLSTTALYTWTVNRCRHPHSGARCRAHNFIFKHVVVFTGNRRWFETAWYEAVHWYTMGQMVEDQVSLFKFINS